MDYEFEESLNKLRELYATDKSILEKINLIIDEKNDNRSTMSKIISEIKFDLLLLFLIVIGIILIGFFNIGEIALYFGGVAFFLAGIGIGMFVDAFGLIFLFSHGMTGLCLMMGVLLSKILENPVLSDGPLHSSIIICGVIVIALFVIATILVIMHNLSITMKKKKYFKVLILFLYFLGFLITALYVHYFPIIY